MAYFIFLILIIFSYSSSTDVAMALPFGVNFLFKYLLSSVSVLACPVIVIVSNEDLLSF
jgi:hypothetical protein